MNDTRRGRPPKHESDVKRIPIGFRTTPEFKAKIDAAAAASGRSLAQEIELRLEQSFRDDRIEAQLEEIKRLLSDGKPQG